MSASLRCKGHIGQGEHERKIGVSVSERSEGQGGGGGGRFPMVPSKEASGPGEAV